MCKLNLCLRSSLCTTLKIACTYYEPPVISFLFLLFVLLHVHLYCIPLPFPSPPPSRLRKTTIRKVVHQGARGSPRLTDKPFTVAVKHSQLSSAVCLVLFFKPLDVAKFPSFLSDIRFVLC